MSERLNPDAGFKPNRRNLLIGLGGLTAGLAEARPARAEEAKALGLQAGQGFRLEAETTVSAARLDREVARAFPKFNAGPVLAPFDPAAHGARDDVRLHRIVAQTTLPETGETLDVTGLLAYPAQAEGTLPVVSWQHGTILSFDQVPSNLVKLADPDYELSDEADSLETLFNLHRFAARGFAVIAADYVGKGPLRNGREEAYVVKDATTRTCLDMLAAGRAALTELGLAPGKLFLNGWSQGALNTQWLHQALRAEGQAIEATAVASPFNDPIQALRFWTGRETFALPESAADYPAIPAWLPFCLIVLLGSYERRYGLDGLLEAAVKPRYRAMARQYWTDYEIDVSEGAPLPTASDLLVEGFMERFTDARNSAFLRHLAGGVASYWEYDSPIRFHFGLADEAIHPEMVARALSAGGKLAVPAAIAGASHRAAFLAALYGDATTLDGLNNAADWFQALAQA